jgi:hypothetical protein
LEHDAILAAPGQLSVQLGREHGGCLLAASADDTLHEGLAGITAMSLRYVIGRAGLIRSIASSSSSRKAARSDWLPRPLWSTFCIVHSC